MANHYLVTGASRGIGFEVVKYLAENDHLITAVARSQDKLSSLRGLYPEQIYTNALDITLEQNRNELVQHFNDKGLTLDGIVHNAGLLINKPFRELTNDEWQQQLNVNLLAPVFLTRDLLPYLNPGSHILNISSMGGFQGSSKFPGLTGYSVAKGALSIFSECLPGELQDKQIKCNCLCLGAVQTEMLESAFPGMDAPVTAGDMGRYISNFLENGHTFYNGKVLPVSLADPS
ncbi:SDR family NAD(P)-dependent oxidoreductase [Rhodohalobacter sp. 8-1]|uniref:SDR family NAD(P)-dependent oxidoreductase n=1 Tax=Rhodohalobacter sp. 8-1 TaxID=3131972 RepID=UPI0030EE999A